MASDIHLKMDGVEGDSTDSGHDKEIELLSYSHGMVMPISGFSSAGSPTTEKPTLQDFTVTKYLDKATSAIQGKLLKGSPIATAVVTVERPDGSGGKIQYAQYDFKNVYISNYSVGSSGSGLPMETISFAYETYQITYTATDTASAGAQGNVTQSWSLALNKEP